MDRLSKKKDCCRRNWSILMDIYIKMTNEVCKMIVDMTNIIAKNSILTGRSALAYRNYGCSSDPRVIMEACNVSKDIYFEPRWIIPMDKNFETESYNGVIIATINQAIFDSIRYDYDDSNIYELMDIMSDEEVEDFRVWLEERPDYYDMIAEKLDEYEFLKR